MRLQPSCIETELVGISRSFRPRNEAARRQAEQDRRVLNDYLLDQSFVMVIVRNPAKVVVRSNVNRVGYTGHESLDLTSAWIT